LIAGRGGAVPVVAAVDAGLVAGPHDDVCVLPAVCAPVHVVQPRQRDGAAGGAGRRCAACGRSDVVHQPHVDDTLDAVLLFFEGREDAASAKVWLDVMATSQHLSSGPSKPPSWWMSTFQSSIARIGGLLLVVDAWDNPTALRRAW
jgi:hypothetical protein